MSIADFPQDGMLGQTHYHLLSIGAPNPGSPNRLRG